jgi:hypothetical protein
MGMGGQYHAWAALPRRKTGWAPGKIWMGAEKFPHRDLFCLFIHCVISYPLSSCHLFFYNTQHEHLCSGFEAAIPAGDRSQTLPVDSSAALRQPSTGGIRSPDRPASSESLYRLSYPGPYTDVKRTSSKRKQCLNLSVVIIV